MNCLNKYLCGIVYLETGEIVHEVPDGCACDVFVLLRDTLGDFHGITACVVFVGVWI